MLRLYCQGHIVQWAKGWETAVYRANTTVKVRHIEKIGPVIFI